MQPAAWIFPFSSVEQMLYRLALRPRQPRRDGAWIGHGRCLHQTVAQKKTSAKYIKDDHASSRIAEIIVMITVAVRVTTGDRFTNTRLDNKYLRSQIQDRK